MTDSMQVVGYRRNLPIDNPESLVDAEIDVPAPGPHDLLVRIEAVSVNPVDVKVRAGSDPEGALKVLGYDAAGTVSAVGPGVTRFRVGDEVYYAGSIARPGTNAQFHLVDEHIVGHKPASLTHAEAAALPLTTITAWETLFDRFALSKDSTGTLLVVGAAGGVGSMIVQLARALTGLTVIGTASRPETRQWVTDLGAHHVVDHHGGLADAVLDVAPAGVDYLFTAFSDGQVEQFARVVRPNGQITAIDDPAGLDLLPLKSKSIAWHWEFMFTRPLFLPTDPTQHEILEQTARLVDDGTLRTTVTNELGPINAANLRQAHALIETSATIGKIVLAGF
ncbi:zinc-binding alcohol dehydrogenase family protein [Micromonospora parathelypteridis]|uniref:Zinc-type alcohol dehydrogenase-like protein n=1 Tax=Micromonospora parathelypteridis TaxID=1839617 RepID=A0A840VTX5_9ACTN|nr:zinc-binding alcohol dehydrogenase family protein [Micromonospora parathelypteridis]MBB5479436.1 zinc-binding alcohol dehydrogenase family protein [Micromonospora parathelypteridis]